jgi:hypothetical protein
MPRKADRRRALDWIEKKNKELTKEAIEREIFSEDDSIQDDEDLHMQLIQKRMERSRYIFREKKYRKRKKKFNLEDCLCIYSETYNDEEFLYNFRLTRESFFLLLEEMESKEAFRDCEKKGQRPVAYQLLVFLWRIGKEGSGGGTLSVSSYFGIGKGSVKNYIKRCISALHEIKEDVVYWPEEDEKEKMKMRLGASGFRHCVGIIDGTLIVLDTRPEKFHECYYSRKSCYALNLMVVCDDRKRITYYYAGWPGSTHDNRVFRNSKLFLKREDFFAHSEYLLGDSAYSPSSIMVQAFKKYAACAHLPHDKSFFNTMLAQVRISSEHCIGILKGRFQCLKRNNIKLKKDGKKEVKEIVDLIGACAVLHNLLINYQEDDIPHEWYCEMNDNIDWTMYDEDEEYVDPVHTEESDRRDNVFKSIVSNYLI